MAEIDEKEAMVPESIRNNILYLSVLISLLLFAFVYIIAKRISLPIVKLKHAENQQAKIELISDNEYVFLNISDNGCGFNYSDDRKLCGNGISNMKERVNLLNGSIEIDSHKELGTRLKLKFR